VMLHFMVQGCVLSTQFCCVMQTSFCVCSHCIIYRFIATPSLCANGVKKYLYLTFHLVAATVHLCVSTVLYIGNTTLILQGSRV
jgi:hypothetical protein